MKNDVIPIPGEKALDKLGLIKCLFMTEQEQDTKSASVECKEKTTEDIVDWFAKVFYGLGPWRWIFNSSW